MDAGEVLVDHFDGGADARAIAEAKDFAGHGIEQSAGGGEGRGTTRRHDGHFAGGGFHGAARDRGVDQPQSGGLEAGFPKRG